MQPAVSSRKETAAIKQRGKLVKALRDSKHRSAHVHASIIRRLDNFEGFHVIPIIRVNNDLFADGLFQTGD